jgi:transcriptional regulator with XRE-family HTH domain
MAPDGTAKSHHARTKAPNPVLRRIREHERRETREEFAEAMARVARNIGEPVYPDAKYVAKLESGDIRRPRPVYRRILSELCGRPFSELGFSPAPGLSLLNVRDSGGSADVARARRMNIALRDAVMASGLELSQFARQVGVDPKSVQRWITRGVVPHPRHRWQACEILGCDESELWPTTVSIQATLALSTVSYQPLFDHEIHRHTSGVGQGDIEPILRNMSRETAISALSALREIHRGYLLADRMMGGLSVTDAVRTQIPVIEMTCEVTRGADRAEVLEFACRFMEFCGWVHQDAGDLACAMYWTDRAFDYAMELGNQRNIAYTLMRKAAIATEAGNPAQGLGIVNFALTGADALTPRMKAVILRQRAHAHAALREPTETARDSDMAIAEAVAGVSQKEEDRAPYCSPMYAAMETGYSMVVAGKSETALPVLARSRAEWTDRSQIRDYALCVSRLATAYVSAGEPEQACATAEEAINLAYGIGSRRVVNELNNLSRMLGQWRNHSAITSTQERLNVLADSFKPEYPR